MCNQGSGSCFGIARNDEITQTVQPLLGIYLGIDCHIMARQKEVVKLMANIKDNQLNGRIAERIAIADLRDNGFTVIPSILAGWDFLAYILDKALRIKQMYVVEVKYITNGRSVKLSKLQSRLKQLCKKVHIDHLTYVVTEPQVRHWLDAKSLDVESRREL